MRDYNDRSIEKRRYDQIALEKFSDPLFKSNDGRGFRSVVPSLRDPYVFYYWQVRKAIAGVTRLTVLELACGTGEFSSIAISHRSNFVGLDISEKSLQKLTSRYDESSSVQVILGDIQSIPLESNSVDICLCAGGLSYGDNQLVIREISRVLSSTGKLICVDSFNHNPIYKFNRWLHLLRGNRSKGTLQRMPSYKTINLLEKYFGEVTVSHFGTLSFLIPVLSLLLSPRVIRKIIRWGDAKRLLDKWAFKIVVVAQVKSRRA